MDYFDFIPRNFRSLMMPKLQKQGILDCIEKQTIPRRLAIFGTTGTGKSTLAGLIAKGINCERFRVIKDNCGRCGSCVQPELTIVDCVNHKRRLNMIDELKNANAFKSRYNRRVVLLDEAQALSPRDQEALLLPVENYKHIQIILCSSRMGDISIPLGTRFAQIEMVRPSQKRALAYYKNRLSKLSMSMDDEELLQIIETSDRLPREIVRRILERQLGGELRRL